MNRRSLFARLFAAPLVAAAPNLLAAAKKFWTALPATGPLNVDLMDGGELGVIWYNTSGDAWNYQPLAVNSTAIRPDGTLATVEEAVKETPCGRS